MCGHGRGEARWRTRGRRDEWRRMAINSRRLRETVAPARCAGFVISRSADRPQFHLTYHRVWRRKHVRIIITPAECTWRAEMLHNTLFVGFLMNWHLLLLAADKLHLFCELLITDFYFSCWFGVERTDIKHKSIIIMLLRFSSAIQRAKQHQQHMCTFRLIIHALLNEKNTIIASLTRA